MSDYLGLDTKAKNYLQYVNTTKHDYLLDVRITKTGGRAGPVTAAGAGAETDKGRGQRDAGPGHAGQTCYVKLRDGEVEIVEFMDTVLEGVKGLLEKHGYDTSGLADAGAYYGVS